MTSRKGTLGEISFEEINSTVGYDPETGLLTWKKDMSSRHKKGTSAGCYRGDNEYSFVRIKGVVYYIHSIAWLLFYGVHPRKNIDHVNGKRGDNRIENLQEITRSGNVFKSKRSKNRDLPRNVYRHPAGGFKVSFSVDGEVKDLGVYGSIEEATDVAITYRKKRNFLNLMVHGCKTAIPA